MSVGCSVLVAFGSYRSKTQELIRSTALIPLLTLACGLLGSLAVFSYIGYCAQTKGIKIEELPSLSGPQLTFIVYPSILASMPFGNFWAVLFFFAMILLGIDTQFGFLDGLVATVEDEIRNHY
jgi:SNF family Na+-dependent transporter